MRGILSAPKPITIITITPEPHPTHPSLRARTAIPHSPCPVLPFPLSPRATTKQEGRRAVTSSPCAEVSEGRNDASGRHSRLYTWRVFPARWTGGRLAPEHWLPACLSPSLPHLPSALSCHAPGPVAATPTSLTVTSRICLASLHAPAPRRSR